MKPPIRIPKGGAARTHPALTEIDFLRKAPLQNLLAHCTLAPTEGPRRQNSGASFHAWILARSAADEILRSRASDCVDESSA
jgi:hypothetical protein